MTQKILVEKCIKGLLLLIDLYNNSDFIIFMFNFNFNYYD